MDKTVMISVVTPTYNERENIPLFLAHISSFLVSLKQPFEVIIVDDSSPDGTSDVVISLKSKYPQVVLLKRVGKRGIGSAYFDGFAKAKGNIIIAIDVDLSQSLTTIPLFLKKLKAGDGMVIASRYLPESEIRNISFYRQLGSKFFNMFVKFMLALPVLDSTHSYRAFKKDVFRDISKKIKENGHPSFFIELSFWTAKAGYTLSEVPTIFVERVHGQSKLNTFHGLKNAYNTLTRLKKNYEV